MATDRTERLLNVVLCLLDAPRPVPRSALRDAVPGYLDATSPEAFERMFERDKEELRAMGVPVETSFTAEGDIEGYRIDARDYAMPELSFTAAELSVISLAALAWSDAAVAAPATAAIRKVEAMSDELPPRHDPPLLAAGSIDRESELPALWEAIRTRRQVTFDYRSLSDVSAAPRVIEPWATVRWQGAWYLVGWNPERQQSRVYRLSRMQGGVRLLKHTFTAVDPGNVRDLVAALAEPEPLGTAVIALPDGRGTGLRVRGTTLSTGLVEVTYTDADYLIYEVCSSGATLIEPTWLRDEQRRALEAVAALHSTPPDAGAPHG